MIEYDETLSALYSGKEALIRRVKSRLTHTTTDIPYFDRGVSMELFTYGTQQAGIKMALRDFGSAVSVSADGGRAVVYNVKIDVSELMGE